MREAAAAVLLLVAAIAGCLGTGPDGDPGAPTPSPSPLADAHQLELTADPADAAGTWGFLSATGNPDGQVAATVVEIPDGSAGMVVTSLVAEEDRSKVTSVAHATIVHHRGRAYPDFIALDPTIDLVQRGAVGSAESTIDPAPDPLWMPTPPSGRIGLLFAVKAEEPVDAGLVYRFHSRDQAAAPGFGAPDETEDALDALPDAPGRLATPTGVADGFSVPLYAEVNLGGTDGWEARSDAIEVEDGFPPTTRPTATLRDLSLSSSRQTAQGWTVATGYYRNLDGVGNWSLDADIYGETTRDRGQFATAEPVTQNRSNLPAFVVMNSGSGSATIDFDITTTGANVEENLIFLQLEVGATMEEMIGTPTVAFDATRGGDIGDGRLDEHGLTLSPRDLTVRVPGLAR